MVLLHLRILNSRHSVPTWIIHSSAGISLGTTKAALEVDLILLYLKICFFSFFFFEDLFLERNVFGLFCGTPEDRGRTPRKYREFNVASV